MPLMISRNAFNGFMILKAAGMFIRTSTPAARKVIQTYMLPINARLRFHATADAAAFHLLRFSRTSA